MKKILISFLLSLITLGSFAQKEVKWWRVTSDSLPLNYAPGGTGNIIKTGYYNINPKTGVQSRFVSGTTWVTDSLFKGIKGDTGAQGIQGIQGIQGPQGLKGDKGDKGDQGIPGTGSGSGGVETAIIYPENHGATGQGRTFAQDGKNQAYVDSVCPGAGFNTNTNRDYAGIQWCLNNSNGKIILLHGNYFTGNTDLIIPKFKNIRIDGAGFTSITPGSGATVGIKSADATSLADANAMINSYLQIENIILNLSGNQVGFNIGPAFMFYGNHLHTFGGNTGFILKFCLQPTLINSTAQVCTNGLIMTYTGITGGGQNTTQTNYPIINNFRTHTCSGTGILYQSSYGLEATNVVFEGNGTITRCMDIDHQGSTTSKNGTIKGYHFEQLGGCTDTQINYATRDGVLFIDDAISHYSGYFCKASSTTGLGAVIIQRYHYGVGNAGKFYTSSNISWFFNYCNNSASMSTAISQFGGTPPGSCSSGYNKVCGIWLRQ